MITREKIIIPTYEMDAPEKTPLFYDVRNHQGTRGNIYPIPMVDSFLDRKSNVEYDCITLENDYIRVRILPELGGRIYEGYDKKADYNFVYKNNVIKPQLIGLAGAWLSGGIEFNWPQHHRPTTFMPIDSWIERNSDGSETAWVGEYEPLSGLKSTTGITIWPDRSYFTASTRLYNPTDDYKTFHWWANLAVHANENYQLKFPPDIDYITYHYKDQVVPFPIVKGNFARADFGTGTDITWFKNIPSPASFFILNSSYDFMSGYDHGLKRGTVHIADHNVSVGKKYFTWGDREFGNQWHKNLTDDDGAYLEIMTGCYTDNQPDFSFLAPDETKVFEQSWYCNEDMPDIKNAEKEGAVGFHIADGILHYTLNTTSVRPGAKLTICDGNNNLVVTTADIEPGKPLSNEIKVPEETDEKDISITLADKNGDVIIDYRYRKPFFEEREKPLPHKPARKPQEISTNDELYIEGLHIEQYRHPTYRAEDYYSEALKRDPGDLRCNNAMGLLCMRQRKIKDALLYFDASVRRATMRNPNPRNGEYYFNYARALRELGKDEESIRCFRKAAWNMDCKAAGLREAAKLYLKYNDIAEAQTAVSEGLAFSADSEELNWMKVYIDRKLGKIDRAILEITQFLNSSPLCYGMLAESWLLTGEDSAHERLLNVLKRRINAWKTLLSFYFEIGGYQEILTLENEAPDNMLLKLYASYAAAMLGKGDRERKLYEDSEQQTLDYCFPSTDDDACVLNQAIARHPEDGKLCYLAAILNYGRDNRTAGAELATEAIQKNPSLHEAHRLLAQALMDVYHDKIGALNEMEKAFSLDQNPRYLLELARYRELNDAPALDVLKFLESYPKIVGKLEEIKLYHLTLCNEAGKPEKTQELLRSCEYHPYEGGEGQVIKAHVLSYLLTGEKKMENGDPDGAETDYQYALTYPENYNEGISVGARQSIVFWHLARLNEMRGKSSDAKMWYEKAANYRTGFMDEGDFYTAISMRKLGRSLEAEQLLSSMLKCADEILSDDEHMPYAGRFISNLPGEHSIKAANNKLAHPARFYALLGLGYKEQAKEEMEECRKWYVSMAWIQLVLKDYYNQ